ncbi:hypothetical protein AO382_1248 [Moraxella catarrhalis]|uniref:Uncharacterized protein n=1 Tax=Moraxella catarrhalis TaxID=480 RepID=A0A7Z1A3N5_MORCA|nr:hypothetical protein AO382_1248 [Moraxella catarrhalis]
MIKSKQSPKLRCCKTWQQNKPSKPLKTAMNFCYYKLFAT